MTVTLRLGTEAYSAAVARPPTDAEAAALHAAARRLCSPLAPARWNRARRERAVLNLLTQFQVEMAKETQP